MCLDDIENLIVEGIRINLCMVQGYVSVPISASRLLSYFNGRQVSYTLPMGQSTCASWRFSGTFLKLVRSSDNSNDICISWHMVTWTWSQ